MKNLNDDHSVITPNGNDTVVNENSNTLSPNEVMVQYPEKTISNFHKNKVNIYNYLYIYTLYN